ncbi:hypothetical protein ACFWN2_27345 [Lentzea sp. NPDC058436]|uniref:hypothetical protein n=1 Tax=Lentzea sp. NPDC058436 TaxID=3346499 RepID=UPI0036640459
MSEELNRERQDLVGLARRFGLPQTVSGDPFPPSQQGAPLIVDTDAGNDSDAAIELVATQPSLALVSTVDQRRGRRLRRLLDLHGRTDVPVAESNELDKAVRRVMTSTDGPVRWAGLGPATNAALALGEPGVAERLVINQAGDPAVLLRDLTAARAVLTRAKLPKLVCWETFRHDGLVVATALQLPFVALRRERVALDEDGRLVEAPGGALVRVTVKADQRAFRDWMSEVLG